MILPGSGRSRCQVNRVCSSLGLPLPGLPMVIATGPPLLRPVVAHGVRVRGGPLNVDNGLAVDVEVRIVGLATYE